MRKSIQALRHAVTMFGQVRERAEARADDCMFEYESMVARSIADRVVAAAGLEVVTRTLRVAEDAGRLLKNRDAAMDDLERGEFRIENGPTPPYRPSANDADREEGGVEIDRAAHAREQVTWLAERVAEFVLSPRESAITEAMDVLARALPGTFEPPPSMRDDVPEL